MRLTIQEGSWSGWRVLGSGGNGGGGAAGEGEDAEAGGGFGGYGVGVPAAGAGGEDELWVGDAAAVVDDVDVVGVRTQDDVDGSGAGAAGVLEEFGEDGDEGGVEKFGEVVEHAWIEAGVDGDGVLIGHGVVLVGEGEGARRGRGGT